MTRYSRYGTVLDAPLRGLFSYVRATGRLPPPQVVMRGFRVTRRLQETVWMDESNRVVRVSPSTLYREVQGETVLLQLDSGEYFGLDETATRIWQLIVEKGDLESVEAAMLEEFEVDPTVVAADVARVVGELAAKGLIEVDARGHRESN